MASIVSNPSTANLYKCRPRALVMLFIYICHSIKMLSLSLMSRVLSCVWSCCARMNRILTPVLIGHNIPKYPKYGQRIIIKYVSWCEAIKTKTLQISYSVELLFSIHKKHAFFSLSKPPAAACPAHNEEWNERALITRCTLFARCLLSILSFVYKEL